MKRRWLLGGLSVAALFSADAGHGARAQVGGGGAPAPARRPPFVMPAGAHYKAECPVPLQPGGPRCFMQTLVDANDRPIVSPFASPNGWGATDLETAYGVHTSGSINRPIIANYIGNHYANAEADNAVYRQQYGLPPCTKASGCFMQVDENGGTNFPSDNGCSGFGGENSLDLAMMTAGCPDCKILLIEGGNNHAAAMATAKKLGAVGVTMSWGYGGGTSDDADFTMPGLGMFAASGDGGYESPPPMPASLTHVVGVGGTKIVADSSTRGYSDTLPSGWFSGTGCSDVIAKPSWQMDSACNMKNVADISANGDNIAFYCTDPSSGTGNWKTSGGTSASSPFATGLLAMMGVLNGEFDSSWVYQNQQYFVDITTGGPVSNCPGGVTGYQCDAVPGYDGPTGIGVPYGPMIMGAPPPGGGSSSSSGSTSGSSSGSSSGSAGSSGSASSGSTSSSTSSGSTSSGSSGSTSSTGSSSGGSSGSTGSGGSTSSGSGTSGGSSGGSGGSGSGSNGNTNGDADAGGVDNGFAADNQTGCGCRTVDPRDSGRGWLAVASLFALVGIRLGARRRANDSARNG